MNRIAVLCLVAAVAQAQTAPSLRIVDSVRVLDLLAREPMIVEHQNGTLFVSGYSDPNPHLWSSGDSGKTWSRVNIGAAADGAIGNSDVDLAVAPDGTLYFAQMGFDRSVGQGTHIAMGVSRDAGATWTWRMLSRRRFVDRPWVKVAADGVAHVIWNDTSGVWYTSSRDGGASWLEARLLHGKGGSSHLAIGPRGRIAMRIAPIAASGNKLDAGVDLVAVSIDGGVTWSTRDAPGSRDWPAPGVQATPRWVEPIAWDSTGALYSFWVNREGVWLARSRDDGANWTSWRLADTPELAYFPYLVAQGRGDLAATWFSGTGATWRAHVARIVAPDSTAPTLSDAVSIQPETWGLSSRRENPAFRSAAGEYLPVLFLRDGSIAVVSAVQDERARNFGFTFWRLRSK